MDKILYKFDFRHDKIMTWNDTKRIIHHVGSIVRKLNKNMQRLIKRIRAVEHEEKRWNKTHRFYFNRVYLIEFNADVRDILINCFSSFDNSSSSNVRPSA